MRELGIDLSDRGPSVSRRSSPGRPTSWSRWDAATPARTSGKRYLDWELPDPKGRTLEEVRTIRDDIARRVQPLVRDLDAAITSPTGNPA
jgi:arsenate reductase (thioredoxin)